MTKERYISMTRQVRRVAERLPGGIRSLSVPTYLCAAGYAGMLWMLAARRDSRFIRAALVPALIFLLVTLLRRAINRPRPYDAFGVPPVGAWEPGKGKSMPSRHAASAAAIAFAVVWVHPFPGAAWVMGGLCALVCALRILSGKHYPSDVAAALILAGIVSYIGYSV